MLRGPRHQDLPVWLQSSWRDRWTAELGVYLCAIKLVKVRGNKCREAKCEWENVTLGSGIGAVSPSAVTQSTGRGCLSSACLCVILLVFCNGLKMQKWQYSKCCYQSYLFSTWTLKPLVYLLPGNSGSLAVSLCAAWTMSLTSSMPMRYSQDS